MSIEGVTIKEYVDQRLLELDKRIEQARSALERNTEQARLNMDKRLDAMNEFREALKDQASRSPTREEVDKQFEHVETQLDILNTFKDSRQGIPTRVDGLEQKVEALKLQLESLQSTVNTIALITKIVGGVMVSAIITLLFAILTHQVHIGTP